MATRSELYDICLLRMGMDTQDRRYDPRVVFSVMDSVRSSLIPDYVTAYGESALELLCVPVVLPVQYDTVRTKQYVQLTFQILGMKDRSGLVQVSLTQEEDNDFVPMQLGMKAVYSGLEAGGAAGNLLYYLEGTRIYFDKLAAGVCDILIKAIPTIYDLVDDDSQVPMPAEFNEMVILGAIEKLTPIQQGQAPIKDKTQDTRVST